MTPRAAQEGNKAHHEGANSFAAKVTRHDECEAMAGVGHMLAEGIEREHFAYVKKAKFRERRRKTIED